MNSMMERWFRGLHAELTDRTLIWNMPHLRRLLCECTRDLHPTPIWSAVAAIVWWRRR